MTHATPTLTSSPVADPTASQLLPALNMTETALRLLPNTVQGALVEVQQLLNALAPTETGWLAETLAHTLGVPGKCLRPTLCLLMGEATGGLKPAHTQTAAVAEMIHVATLLHDDVLDDADLRRNQPTARTHWGNTVSILSGDYLLAEASRLLAKIGHIRLVAIFSDVLADLCSGEVEQLRTQRQWPSQPSELPTLWQSYYQKTMCKTASLFAAACESGAWLNNLDETSLLAVRSYGEQLGIAFQLIDDWLDYSGTVAGTGKPVMGDIQQGLVTAPLLLALESTLLTPAQHAELSQAVQTTFTLTSTLNPETPSADDARLTLTSTLKTIQTLVHASGAEAALQAKAQEAVDAAVASLTRVCKPSPAQEALVALAQGSIGRQR
ncbi:MAG: polyprenyl synthetase family protein [Vampirovibrionales bacterium]|nr:polyprenyl synthetase family protein [Vampirovibrionales bacterium]